MHDTVHEELEVRVVLPIDHESKAGWLKEVCVGYCHKSIYSGLQTTTDVL